MDYSQALASQKKELYEKLSSLNPFSLESGPDQVKFLTLEDEKSWVLHDSLFELGIINEHLKSECPHDLDGELDLILKFIEEIDLFQLAAKSLQNSFSTHLLLKFFPKEKQDFDEIVKKTSTLSETISESKSVLNLEDKKGIFEVFRISKVRLEEIGKEIEKFIKNKRNSYPSLYFLSNDELFDFLSDENFGEKDLGKFFNNVEKYEKDGNLIKGIISRSGEKLEFSEPLDPKNLPLDQFFCVLSKAINTSIHNQLKNSVELINNWTPEDELKFIEQSLSQIGSTISNIHWTKLMEKGILEGKKHPFDNVSDYLAMLLKLIVSKFRGELKPTQRFILETIFSSKVYSTEVISDLKKKSGKIKSLASYDWFKVLKAYWRPESLNVHYEIGLAVLPYGNEFNSEPAVFMTSSAQQTYLSIAKSIHEKRFVSLYGKAGTGKTETLKEFSKILGRKSIVFNCSDQVDVGLVRKIMLGTLQQGAWLILDEFNRIDAECLKSIAQIFKAVQSEYGKKSLNLCGDEVAINPLFHVSITINPGYAGKFPLPKECIDLFRSHEMISPDESILVEMMLGQEGFFEFGAVTKLIYILTLLKKQLLPETDHYYDFGIRKIRRICKEAGTLLRERKIEESGALLLAIQHTVIPELCLNDENTVNEWISNIFGPDSIPEKNLEDPNWGQRFTLKVNQLYSLLSSNLFHNILILGDSKDNSKNEILDVVAKSFQHLKKIHVEKIVIQAEKNISESIYGVLDGNEKWTDGSFTKVLRSAGSCSENDKELWIVFQMPLNPIWVEGLLSVLDENKCLCLTNGECIKLAKNVRLIFLDVNAKNVTPAFVSRLQCFELAGGDV